MNEIQDTVQYLDTLNAKMIKYSSKRKIGDEFQQGIQLAKTDKGARTNARIDAIQKGVKFDESDTPIDELKTVNDDIVNEILNRAINDILGIK